MIIRAKNICLEEEDKGKETRNIAIGFRENGYPQTIIKKAQKPTRAEKEETEHKCTIRVPYSGHFPQKFPNLNCQCLKPKEGDVSPIQSLPNKRNDLCDQYNN
uniref:Helix-turn-helix domain-containing protein n=1 Tax=Romanomermis culicivorax TaxID=13658 RepID=A0A915HVR7_ROMCU